MSILKITFILVIFPTMAKRKAGVNDIIYELDNEDIDSSSEDEVKEPKIVRLEADIIPISSQSDVVIEESCTDVINIDTAFNEAAANEPNKHLDNGGKTPDLDINDGKIDLQQTELVDSRESSIKKSTQVREDANSKSKSDVSAESGCTIPLLTVHFKNTKLARYRDRIKEFLVNLIRVHDKDALDEFESDTELQLDIWPEDLVEDDTDKKEKEAEDATLFFVDTDPSPDRLTVVPSYKKLHTSILISNEPKPNESPPPTPARRALNCFNCDGNHNLRDCPLPRNQLKIAEKRRQVMSKTGRYHLEDEQKFGHLVPGRLSGQLRHALGLSRHQLPLHVYRMRLLGYPPGWLEEARISHSGISMFDSTGNPILDPEDEEGMICEPGCKDKFDIKKILDFPGFNVPASPQYQEEAHLFGLPPMSEQDSKVTMLQMLAPNAMMAYKRKKLTISDTNSIRMPLEGQAEMELDSDDEKTEFPSVPPLPDEAPPPPPPPPPSSPPPPPASSPPPPPGTSPLPPLPSSPPPLPTSSSPTEPLSSLPPLPPASSPPPQPPSSSSPKPMSSPPPIPVTSSSPTPPTSCPLPPTDAPESLRSSAGTANIETPEIINISDTKADESADDDVETLIQTNGDRESPSLDDLEAKKKALLDALEGEEPEAGEIIEEDVQDVFNGTEKESVITTVDNENKTESEMTPTAVKNAPSIPNDIQVARNDDAHSNVALTEQKSVSISEVTKTPDSKATGQVKTTQYGTPVMNIASHYDKLPSDEKFAKDITDVINFENLPNSTGNYKKMCSLLKKVKSEVERIQES